jgi:glycosyltransferase involved in cell wall biosynthesis
MSARPILFVDHAPALGGAEHSLLLLLRHLDRTRWQPHLAGVQGALLAAAADCGVAIHPLPMPRLRRSPRFPVDVWKTASALAGAAREASAALLYANTVRAAIYTAPVARRARLPFVWHMRDFWLSEAQPERPALDALGKRLLAASAALVLANSQAVAEWLPAMAGAKVQVVHNGIELAAFRPGDGRYAFRERHQIPPDAPVLGMVGRLRPWKGQERFLRLAARVRARHPDARFVVVGGAPFGVPGDYPDRLRRLAEELSLGESLVFSGHLDDVRPALAAFDLFIHPGDPEPFGLVNVEAMAMALPVVAFGHGALPEIVEDGVTGRLVPPGDEGALAAAALRLLDDPERRAQMGRAGRERVAEQFRIERTVEQIDRRLTMLLAG